MASIGINKVILVGNLGANPELKQSQNNMTIATLNVATSASWKDKRTGEFKEQTEWHRCVAFRRLAEISRDYLTKGSKVFIEGKLQTRKWRDQNGQDRYITEVVILDMQMLDTKKFSASSNNVPDNRLDKNSLSKKFDPHSSDDGELPF